MAASRECVFCSIVTGGGRPHEVVAETPRAVAFMNAEPAVFGHVLVIPKAHAATIWDLSHEDGDAVWRLTREIARAVREALARHGLNLFHASGRAAWQSVDHFHVHVIPRSEADPLVPNWNKPSGDVTQIPVAADRPRAVLRPEDVIAGR
ncbi:MAG: HIT family protein [Actinomycetota bacterium]